MVQCYGAYIHPPFLEHLFQLSKSQLQILTHDNVSNDASLEEDLQFALPFTPEPNAMRVDHCSAFQDLHIYRDRYEREIMPFRHTDYVIRMEDHPQRETEEEFIRYAKGLYDE